MDLINATGETLGWKCDGKLYQFPAGELGRVTDEVGRHLLNHLGRKGLQEVRYGDDPEKVGLKAVSQIVKFHRDQITIHEAMNAEQDQQKLSKLVEPEGVRHARASLKAYEPHFARMLDQASEAEQEEIRKDVESGLVKKAAIPQVDDMDIDELRDTLAKAGGDPGRMSSRKSLLKAIKAQVADREDG